jgi:hypothetical protein
VVRLTASFDFLIVRVCVYICVICVFVLALTDMCISSYDQTVSMHQSLIRHMCFTVLGLEHRTGNFEMGKDLDALLIDPKSPNSPLDVFEKDTIADIIQKFIYLGKKLLITII